MQPSQLTYPIFEANQVLTNAHLNQVFDYLYDQERLTRANLIGIGIVCGLEIGFNNAAKTISLSKGCGITSEGYLIVEPQDVVLTRYRSYTLPADLAVNSSATLNTNPLATYTMWELFPDGEPNTSTLNQWGIFTNNKAVLLFLEVKKESLRNCSPNNCDDKGAGVTPTVRRLLISTTDLLQIIARANGLEATATRADLEIRLFNRLNLPDLRLQRWNVPNTHPVTSKDVLTAFQAIVKTSELVKNLASALSATYQAFRPILIDSYTADPFIAFEGQFSFLETMPATTTQIRFLPYYIDFFDDLISAYEELRWKGAELICACCPDEGLFPRHLMLGALTDNSAIYRQQFLSSPAVSGCELQENEVKTLFQRLVNMISSFTNSPALPVQVLATKVDDQIRITPSKFGDVPLSEKAIPYYYLQTGNPKLFQLWNVQKTNRHRANYNLSYRSDEYTPAAPAFVTSPLRYNLEPYNFLRVEGHIGKNYQLVLNRLLNLKEQYRLPINIIALRTGALDENIQEDLTKETARFQDLETLYDAFREDLLRNLTEGIMFLYDIKIPENKDPGGAPNHLLLKKYAPAYRFLDGTAGAWYEKNLTQIQGRPYIDVDQNKIDNNSIFYVYCFLFANTSALPPEYYAHIVSIYYLSKLSEIEILPASLDQLAFSDFENKYQDLISLTRFFRNAEKKNFPTQLQDYVPKEELIDYFNQVLFSCRLDAMKAIYEEYNRRVREVKQKQFFSYFIRNHPGIQHKAGVPMGGTFIIVYHDQPDPVQQGPPFTFTGMLAGSEEKIIYGTKANTKTLASTINDVRSKPAYKDDKDLQQFFDDFTAQIIDIDPSAAPKGTEVADKIFDDAIGELIDGAVIADFFLPYLCGGEGSSVQFILSRILPTFTVEVGCTDEGGNAKVTLTMAGGVPPYSIKIDSQNYLPLNSNIVLAAGSHLITIKDAEGTESTSQTIKIPDLLTLGKPSYKCTDGKNEYVTEFEIYGGTPPYAANIGTIDNEKKYISPAIAGDTETSIIINDSKNCKVQIRLNHSCLPPVAFTARVGCTNQATGKAPVQITPSGGIAPYKVIGKLGNGTFTEFTSPLMLPVGTHTILIRDSSETTTPPQIINVLHALVLTVVEYSCLDNGMYQAFIRIEGGMAPYRINGVEITGNDYTTQKIKSGISSTIAVQDKNNCTASIVVAHTCEEPCNLPCKGESIRCGYRFWLPTPDPGNKKAFDAYGVELAEFMFEYPEGNKIDLTGQVETLIQASETDLNTNFEGVVQKWIAELNQLIAAKIGNADSLKLSYSKPDTSPFGILWIEHFKCLPFTFHIKAIYNFSKENKKIDLEYTPQGTMWKGEDNEKPAKIPAFNCVEISKCQPEKPEIEICKKVDLKLNIIKEKGDAGIFPLLAEATGTDAPIVYLWEVEDGVPAISNEANEHFRFLSLQPNIKRIRLSAFTEKGCMVVIEDIIDLQKP